MTPEAEMLDPTDLKGSERVEDLLRRMTLEEKVGQLNAPILGWTGVVVKDGAGVQLEDPSSVPLPTTIEHAEAIVRGDYEDGIGPGGGFFLLNAFTMDGTSLSQQSQEHARLQEIARGTRMGIPLMQITEGNHGMWSSGSTVFPEPLSLGGTWDLELVRDVYSAQAREARASGVHVMCTLFPEPIRDPRPGRAVELFAECPYLTARMIEAVINGSSGSDPSAPDKVGVILIDFPASSAPAGGLERGPIELSERALRETWFPGWIAGIGAGATGVMVAWNAVDGDSAHGSEWLLTDVLRHELGFTGFTVTEGMGLSTLLLNGIAASQEEAGQLAIRAGVDLSINYEEGYRQPLLEGVREGAVDEALVDRAVRRLLMVKERLGLFDQSLEADPALLNGRPPEHRDLALRAARDGIVLLKNEGQVLPLSRGCGRIAVIGPLADDARSLLGDYVATHIPQPVPSILDAIAEQAAPETEVVHRRGCEVIGGGTEGIAEAVAAARDSEVAIVVLGERIETWPKDDSDRNTMGEMSDIASLDLTGHQQQLVEAVHATGTPTVVVLINGHPLSVRWMAEHVPAIVEGWVPGECGGRAIAEVLFGEQEPSGRLSVTIPRHVGQLPLTYDHKWQKNNVEDHDYRYVDVEHSPLFPFGHGLGYTDYRYTDLVVERAAEDERALVRVRLQVENTGERAGREVVQLYASDRLSSLMTPVQRLCGFAKVSLEAGERQTLELPIYAEQLALFDRRRRWVVEAGDFDLQVGRSSQDIRLRGSFAVEEEIEVPGNFPLGTAE